MGFVAALKKRFRGTGGSAGRNDEVSNFESPEPSSPGASESRMGRFTQKIRDLSPKGNKGNNSGLAIMDENSAPPTSRLARIAAKITSLSPKGNKSNNSDLANTDETSLPHTSRFGRIKAKLMSLSQKTQEKEDDDRFWSGGSSNAVEFDRTMREPAAPQAASTKKTPANMRKMKRAAELAIQEEQEAAEQARQAQAKAWADQAEYEDDMRPRYAKRRHNMTDGIDFGPGKLQDPYKDLVLYRTYCYGYGKDPFRLLSNEWLEGDGVVPMMTQEEWETQEELKQQALEDEEEELKQQQARRIAEAARRAEAASSDDDDDIPEPEVEDEEAKQAREEAEAKAWEADAGRRAEKLRLEELLRDKCGGWKEWLRGRDLRSEFKIQPQTAQGIREMEEKLLQQRAVKGPARMTVADRTVKGKNWVRAPVDAREVNGEQMCWRQDFVKNAKTDADILGLDRPTLSADKFREMARLDWNIMNMFYWYVEACDLNGNRELWSPTFVGFLWEYWQRSELGEHVGTSEKDLENLAQDERLVGLKATYGLQEGLFRRKPVEWPKPIWKPPYLKVEPKVFHILDKPRLPPIPRRMQGSCVYKEGPIEYTLAKNLKGTEAWDSMVGITDRLQAAGRSTLRLNELEDESERIMAIARAKYYAEHPEADDSDDSSPEDEDNDSDGSLDSGDKALKAEAKEKAKEKAKKMKRQAKDKMILELARKESQESKHRAMAESKREQAASNGGA